MKFISQTSPSNVLTDGQSSCAYGDIPKVFDRVRRYLAEKNILPEDCLAFECGNSVPDALILLYLLEEGHNFLLLAKGTKSSRDADVEPFFPAFCRYRLDIMDVDDARKIDSPEPERFLRITENQEWNGNQTAGQKFYLRTSGSTGSPKMAMHSHARFQGNVLNCVQRLRLDSNDRIAIPVPIYHMYGLGAAFLPGVAAGASIDLQKGANIIRYLQRERAFDPNVVFMTPVFCETLLKGRRSPREYRLTVLAGDRIRENTFEKYESLFGCLVQLYGSTEMGAIAAASPDMPSKVRATTAGKPMTDVQMRLGKGSSETGGNESAMEATDELWCHHQYGFEGYVDENGNPIDSGEEYQDGWFRTKDFGRIKAGGYLEVLGRYDHSVNRDGLLVFFSDVEKALETIEGVDSATVIAKGEGLRGKRLIAYCVPVKNAELTEQDIRTASFDLLPKHAIPYRIIVIDSLPLLPNGKVDRQRLGKDIDIAESR
uniref:AMP-binding enzyme C-terminal domain-containing protein n=1 Tax=Candidatus Kentrum sp. FW TaxID=2126338 RepID=A0A450S890_9GAMM|nr:MAG: AMP-binding enzyme C-terminal domain-containing protein [Candidatus Kentron sp. FW]